MPTVELSLESDGPTNPKKPDDVLFSSQGAPLDGVIETYDLTAREREILRLVLPGAGNKDIEKKLFISGSTVRNHPYSVFQKLDVNNRLELINRIAQAARPDP